jgi:type IV pilus assembly protein PilO
MPDLRETRKKIKTALIVLGCIDVLALVAYFSPLVGSAESRRMEMNQLQAELNIKTRQVKPLANLPEKVVLANHQITDFYRRRFPSQQSQIVDELGKLAVADGVTIESVKYKVGEEGAGRLQPVEMEANLAGNYVALAKFINAIERDETFFIISGVTLGGEQQGPVRLSVKLEAYLKAGA